MLRVEFGGKPGGSAMAHRAVRPKLARMRCRFRMTGHTGRACPLELPIAMTVYTSHIHMRARQWEVAQVVIKRRGTPAIHRMTGRTIHAKTTLVRLIVMVTRVAILQNH